MKTAVVTGWPGTITVGEPRPRARATNTAAAVNPKNSQSAKTTYDSS